MEEPPQSGQRDLLPGADRGALARLTCAFREVEDCPRPSSALVGGRHLGPNAFGGPGRWGRRGAAGLEPDRCGFHLLPRSPARRRMARKAAPANGPKKGVPAQHREDEGLGRSRGGLTSKIHLACEGGLRPLALLVTPGQTHDGTVFEAVVERIRVPRQAGGTPALDPTRSARTRHTPPAAYAPTCGDVRSRTPSQRRRTRPGTAWPAAPPVAARPASTAPRTNAGTKSSAPSMPSRPSGP